jgi:hypothetical protein
MIVTNITANEPPINSLRDRQIRFDINCIMTNGELCNVEMTLSPSTFEPYRLEYYAGELHTSQEIRGTDKSWGDLKPSYQISFLMENIRFDNIGFDSIGLKNTGSQEAVFIHYFEYYDPKNNVSLGGQSRIITVELAKLDKIAEKPVPEMTCQERWGVFFRFLTDLTKRHIINEILKDEEGIAMAGAVLQTISRNQEERLRLITEHKNFMDWQSGMVEATRKGIAIGEERGIVIGEERGIVIGEERATERERANTLAVQNQLDEALRELERLRSRS